MTDRGVPLPDAEAARRRARIRRFVFLKLPIGVLVASVLGYALGGWGPGITTLVLGVLAAGWAGWILLTG